MVPSLNDELWLAHVSQINPLLPQSCSVVVFITATENKWGQRAVAGVQYCHDRPDHNSGGLARRGKSESCFYFIFKLTICGFWLLRLKNQQWFLKDQHNWSEMFASIGQLIPISRLWKSAVINKRPVTLRWNFLAYFLCANTLKLWSQLRLHLKTADETGNVKVW